MKRAKCGGLFLHGRDPTEHALRADDEAAARSERAAGDPAQMMQPVAVFGRKVCGLCWRPLVLRPHVVVVRLVPLFELPDGASQVLGLVDQHRARFDGRPERCERGLLPARAVIGLGPLFVRDIARFVGHVGGSVLHGISEGVLSGGRRRAGPARRLFICDGSVVRAVRAVPARVLRRRQGGRRQRPGASPERGRLRPLPPCRAAARRTPVTAGNYSRLEKRSRAVMRVVVGFQSDRKTPARRKAISASASSSPTSRYQARGRPSPPGFQR